MTMAIDVFGVRIFYAGMNPPGLSNSHSNTTTFATCKVEGLTHTVDTINVSYSSGSGSSKYTNNITSGKYLFKLIIIMPSSWLPATIPELLCCVCVFMHKVREHHPRSGYFVSVDYRNASCAICHGKAQR